MKRAEFRQTDQIPSYSPQESTLSTSPTTTTSMSDVALHIVFAGGFFDSTGPFPVHSKELLPRGESFLGMTWRQRLAMGQPTCLSFLLSLSRPPSLFPRASIPRGHMAPDPLADKNHCSLPPSYVHLMAGACNSSAGEAAVIPAAHPDGQAVSNFHRTPALNSTQQPNLPWSTTLPQQDKNNLGAPLPDDGAVFGRELPAARLNSRSSSGRSPSSKT
ncbi:hypothetical protein CABS01_01341 [Colletotrichum abscissum]|uniref:uncharacterized protein n=1 Tax=Colletotrichum abscissum TaxID=1671311 RepID=UPI0027D48288|nr:uncharacterized protein CABS01_01341 [Colletotrichum abscissum]KAK1505873.1 hypothetical protein CABS01_01341 [Colletotrichum abscissum]